MSINQSMNISLNSMKNNQLALTVVSHNIANLNTKGYAKERVDFSESRFPVNSNSVVAKIHALNGSDISSITSYIDEASFRNMIGSNTDANYYNGIVDGLSDLEDVADELGDNGLNALLNDFFKASANLEQFPADLSIRQQYILALDNVCDKFNHISSRYNAIEQEKVDDVFNSVDEVNSLLNNLTSLNLAHVKNGQGSSTQSEINAVLSELSNYLNITYDKNSNGTYNVYLEDVTLVQGMEQVYELQADFDPEAEEPAKPLTISLKSVKEPDRVKEYNDGIKSGSLKSSLDFINETNTTVGYSTVKDMKTAIKSAQEAFTTALNGIQTYVNEDDKVYAAYITSVDGELVLASTEVPDEGGGESTYIPTLPPELLEISEDGKISIKSEIREDPFKIAAARINLNNYLPEEDWTKSIGNADNATLMTALQNEKICSYGSGTNNATLSQFLVNNAAKNGMDLDNMANKADVYQGIADADAQDYENQIGVNLDEELADMIKYQRAYEASATIFSVINNIMQTIMGMV